METMAARVREHATYEDLVRVPDHLIAELVDGELYTSPRPAVPHAESATELVAILRSFFGPRGRGSWHILFEPELHLGDDVLVPDLAGWRVDRVPVIPRKAAVTIVPDWVCEVLSVSTARFDRAKKLPLYARRGVGHAWIVDVDLQLLEIKRLNGTTYSDAATHSGDAVIRAEPFEDVEINLTYLWGPLPA
jgi:Uma2 family endonuclease